MVSCEDGDIYKLHKRYTVAWTSLFLPKFAHNSITEDSADTSFRIFQRDEIKRQTPFSITSLRPFRFYLKKKTLQHCKDKPNASQASQTQVLLRIDMEIQRPQITDNDTEQNSSEREDRERQITPLAEDKWLWYGMLCAHRWGFHQTQLQSCIALLLVPYTDK